VIRCAHRESGLTARLVPFTVDELIWGGRECGRIGIEEFLRTKNVYIPL